MLASLFVLATATAAPRPAAEISSQQLRHALSEVHSGHFKVAVGELREFVSRYPNHVYGDYAHYWLAYAHYRQREWALAEVTSDFLLFRHATNFTLPETQAINALSRWQRGARERTGEEIKAWLLKYPNNELVPLVEATLFGNKIPVGH